MTDLETLQENMAVMVDGVRVRDGEMTVSFGRIRVLARNLGLELDLTYDDCGCCTAHVRPKGPV